MIAHCKCGKTKLLRGHRHNFTCAECREIRQKRRNATAVDVACAGCGRTTRLQPSKITPCDGYTCAYGSCKLVPEFQIPEAPIGWYCQIEYNAAGGFCGWSYKQHTPETLAAVWRACEIRDAALASMGERRP